MEPTPNEVLRDKLQTAVLRLDQELADRRAFQEWAEAWTAEVANLQRARTTTRRVGDPRQIVVYEAREKGIEVPKAFYEDAMALHAARNQGFAKAAQLEQVVLAWCDSLGLHDNVHEVEACAECGRELTRSITTI